MSLRDGGFPSKQSPVSRGDIVPFGDCLPYGYDVATCARNDMQTVSHKGMISHRGTMSLRESPTGMILQSAAGEEWTRRRTLLPSVLDKAFKGEL